MTEISDKPNKVRLSYTIAELPLTLDFSGSTGLQNISEDVEAQQTLTTYLQGELANYARAVEQRCKEGDVQGIRTSIHVQGVPFEAQGTLEDILSTCTEQSGLTGCQLVFR